MHAPRLITCGLTVVGCMLQVTITNHRRPSLRHSSLKRATYHHVYHTSFAVGTPCGIAFHRITDTILCSHDWLHVGGIRVLLPVLHSKGYVLRTDSCP